MLARLFGKKFDIVSCAKPDQLNFVRQIFGNFNCRSANGTGGTKKNDVFHRVKTCRKYKYISGALNNKLSSKSRIPPIPGKNCPESLTPASRLKIDSIKSPITAALLSTTPNIRACSRVIPGIRSPAKCANTRLAAVETKIAPPNPSQ